MNGQPRLPKVPQAGLYYKHRIQTTALFIVMDIMHTPNMSTLSPKSLTQIPASLERPTCMFPCLVFPSYPRNQSRYCKRTCMNPVYRQVFALCDRAIHPCRQGYHLLPNRKHYHSHHFSLPSPASPS
uniref:Uncharacterized protein n=1 Tax=Opuntia streptacantha TaxID=393608 RepID=A0A7C8ZVV8_OPUST